MKEEKLRDIIYQKIRNNESLLSISNCQLKSLPSEIGQLTNLTTLDVSHNLLSSLPAEICQLTNLRELHASDNAISSLPAGIGQLTNLKKLYVAGNQLSTLPSEIGQLTKLTKLDVSDNRLSSLPADICQLTNLRELYASDNAISSLPAGIGQLTNLTGLYLYDNQLRILPAEISQLTNLVELMLNPNPLVTPPIEIAKNGVYSIRDYFRQLDVGDKDYIYEAKLLIVGEAGAGKTSLSKKIEDQSYQLKDEVSTKGIDIIQWKFPSADGRDFRINIWDFGGQEIYHTTHQFFLTKRSLYILVADTRKEDTDFYYWCNIVSLLSDNSPLLIIKNEKQDRSREINESQLRGQFTNFKEIIATNLATNRGLDEIIFNIKHYINTLPHIGSALPKTWVNVREVLEKNRYRNYISLEEYFKICEDHGFKLRKDKLQLSGYLHDLGVCLHFQEDPVLKKTVIVNPDWGTTAVYKLLDNESVINNYGRFTRSDLEKIWSEDRYVEMQDELLQLMINFKLCYKIPGTIDHYIAPQLLSVNQPDYDWDGTSNLMLRYVYEFMPKGIITRFIAVMHSMVADQNKVWKSGVVLKKDETFAEIIEYYENREIRIRISGKNKRDLLVISSHEMDRINKSFHQLKYNKLIPCNCYECKSDGKPHFYEYKDLMRRLGKGRQEVECNRSYEMINVSSLIEEVLNEKIHTLSAQGTKLKRDQCRIGKVKRNAVFVSYSHKDKGILERVQAHLKVLEYEGISVNLWDDTQIKAGMNWIDEIKKALSVTKVAILLISTEFLASDFIRKGELPYLLKAAERDGATILPLILKLCRFSKNKELSEFQAVNDPNKPLSKLTEDEQDEVLLKLTDRIVELTL